MNKQDITSTAAQYGWSEWQHGFESTYRRDDKRIWAEWSLDWELRGDAALMEADGKIIAITNKPRTVIRWLKEKEL